MALSVQGKKLNYSDSDSDPEDVSEPLDSDDELDDKCPVFVFASAPPAPPPAGLAPLSAPPGPPAP